MKPHRSAFEFCEVLDIKPTLILRDSLNGSCYYKKSSLLLPIYFPNTFRKKIKNTYFSSGAYPKPLSGLHSSCRLTNDLHPDHFLDRLDLFLRLYPLYIFLNVYLFVLTGYLFIFPLLFFVQKYSSRSSLRLRVFFPR